MQGFATYVCFLNPCTPQLIAVGYSLFSIMHLSYLMCMVYPYCIVIITCILIYYSRARAQESKMVSGDNKLSWSC